MISSDGTNKKQNELQSQERSDKAKSTPSNRIGSEVMNGMRRNMSVVRSSIMPSLDRLECIEIQLQKIREPVGHVRSRERFHARMPSLIAKNKSRRDNRGMNVGPKLWLKPSNTNPSEAMPIKISISSTLLISLLLASTCVRRCFVARVTGLTR